MSKKKAPHLATRLRSFGTPRERCLKAVEVAQEVQPMSLVGPIPASSLEGDILSKYVYAVAFVMARGNWSRVPSRSAVRYLHVLGNHTYATPFCGRCTTPGSPKLSSLANCEDSPMVISP